MRNYRDFVYLDSDNYVPLTLTDNGAPIAGGISDLSRAVATLSAESQGDVVIDSNTAADAFDWTTDGDASVIRLKFGGQSIPTGLWQLRLETFDGGNVNVVWCDPTGPALVQLEVVEAA